MTGAGAETGETENAPAIAHTETETMTGIAGVIGTLTEPATTETEVILIENVTTTGDASATTGRTSTWNVPSANAKTTAPMLQFFLLLLQPGFPPRRPPTVLIAVGIGTTIAGTETDPGVVTSAMTSTILTTAEARVLVYALPVLTRSRLLPL